MNVTPKVLPEGLEYFASSTVTFKKCPPVSEWSGHGIEHLYLQDEGAVKCVSCQKNHCSLCKVDTNKENYLKIGGKKYYKGCCINYYRAEGVVPMHLNIPP